MEAAAAPESVFARIVCGVDGSPGGYAGVEQAGRLLAPGGMLVAASVAELDAVAHAGWAAPFAAGEERERAEQAAAEAGSLLANVPGAETRVVEGLPGSDLPELARELDATLLAVGSHDRRRVVAVLFGSVAAAVLRAAPCPVLVARPVEDAGGFPRRVVVGHDGSDDAAAAAAAAAELAERLGAELRVVASSGGKPVDVDGLSRVEGLEWDERPPVDALVAAGGQADLLAVGSRGRHGLAALGSVSERVAHTAPCSVLVVRRREERSG